MVLVYPPFTGRPVLDFTFGSWSADPDKIELRRTAGVAAASCARTSPNAGDGLNLGWRTGNPVGFGPIVIVTINPLAPASIFWNNQLLRSERAVNRLDRKLT